MRELPKYTKEQAIYYLSALIDGEGSFCLTRDRNGIRMLQIANTDLGIIAAACECFDVLGVTYRVYDKNERGERLGKKPIKVVTVGRRENFIRLHRLLQLRAQEKSDKLLQIVESYKDARIAA